MRPTSVALLVALGVTTVTARQAIPQATGPNVARDLRGAIDIHVHSDPDKVPRVPRRARGGAVRQRKRHARDRTEEPLRSDSRSGLAGTQAHARNRGVRWNRSEPPCWRHERSCGREHGPDQRRVGTHRLDVDVRFGKSGSYRANRTRRSCASRQNGALLPETKAVIAAIAKHNLVMASGHVSAAGSAA